MRGLKILFCILLLSSPAMAQYYTLGEDPASIRWRQINTVHFQIIFPSQNEAQAQRLASILENAYSFAGVTLDHKPKKISVVIHTKSITSNGYVAWAPKRMELFTTPSQDIYGQTWIDQLAIHEIRHVVQIDKINEELPAILKVILGEQAAALTIGAYIPFWFLEGDAVVNETAFSCTGRGRLPSFEIDLKAQCLEKGIYSFDKAYLGSFKDYVPDHYKLGYQLVGGVRAIYGPHVWSKVLSHVAKNPLGINSFSQGLIHTTGKNQLQLYDTIFAELKSKWQKTANQFNISDLKIISKETKSYCSYRYPCLLNDSTIVALKLSLDDIPRFIQINSKGVEKILFTPGNILDESVSCNGEELCWIEYKSDIRWANRSFSRLRKLNLKNGNIHNQTFKEKIFAPALARTGNKIAVVKLAENNLCSILILDSNTFKSEKEIYIPNGLQAITPSWGEDEHDLFLILLGENGKTIAQINQQSSEIKTLKPFSHTEYQRPIQIDHYLYYLGDHSGKDELYRFDLRNHEIKLVAQPKYGFKDLYYNTVRKLFLTSNYTANGYQIIEVGSSSDQNEYSDLIQSPPFLLANTLSTQESHIIKIPNGDTTRVISNQYSKMGHLINFHSWSPVYIDLDQEVIRPGLSLMSQNKLSTAFTQLGYDYSAVNRSGIWSAKMTYSGLYPVIEVNTDFSRQNSYYYQVNSFLNQFNQVVRRDTQKVNFNYGQFNLKGIVSIPLNFSSGKMNRFVQPEFQVGWRKNYLQSSSPFENNSDITLIYRLYGYNQRMLGHRDMQPATGQVIDFKYIHSPTPGAFTGQIWSGEGTLFLPGFKPHHGFRIYTAYQFKSSKSVLSDYINYPRGVAQFLNKELFSAKSDYLMPLFYPDWSLGKLTYVKRVAIRLFYDFGWATIPLQQQNSLYKISYNSIGGEITADCHFLRLKFPAQIGIRGSYLPKTNGTTFFEFLFSFNLHSL